MKLDMIAAKELHIETMTGIISAMRLLHATLNSLLLIIKPKKNKGTTLKSNCRISGGNKPQHLKMGRGLELRKDGAIGLGTEGNLQ